MQEKTADTCVTITIEEYRELVVVSAKYYELLSKYLNLEKEARALRQLPTFGGPDKEVNDDTNS